MSGRVSLPKYHPRSICCSVSISKGVISHQPLARVGARALEWSRGVKSRWNGALNQALFEIICVSIVYLRKQLNICRIYFKNIFGMLLAMSKRF